MQDRGQECSQRIDGAPVADDRAEPPDPRREIVRIPSEEGTRARSLSRHPHRSGPGYLTRLRARRGRGRLAPWPRPPRHPLPRCLPGHHPASHRSRARAPQARGARPGRRPLPPIRHDPAHARQGHPLPRPPHVQRLRRLGFPEDQIQTVMLDFVDGLARQLFNCPLDMLVEHNLYHDIAALRPSQFLSLRKTHHEAAIAVTNPDVRRLSPPTIYRASVTLNHAYALFTDWLFSGATTYAQIYRQTDTLDTAQRLFQAWQTMMRTYRPGDEYALVDEFARILGLQDWYVWQPLEPSSPEGPTNPQLLRAKHPAAVMYCLGALQRFQAMDKDQIFRIGAEIALLGQTGIDYASPEPKYTLRSLPGEKFTGLQLLCFMYVAFQQVHPELDLHLDLQDAYAQALQLFQAHPSTP